MIHSFMHTLHSHTGIDTHIHAHINTHAHIIYTITHTPTLTINININTHIIINHNKTHANDIYINTQTPHINRERETKEKGLTHGHGCLPVEAEAAKGMAVIRG